MRSPVSGRGGVRGRHMGSGSRGPGRRDGRHRGSAVPVPSAESVSDSVRPGSSADPARSGQRSRWGTRSAHGQRIAGARSKGRSTSRVGGSGAVGRVRQRCGEAWVERRSSKVRSAVPGPGRASRPGRRSPRRPGRQVEADLTSAFRSAVAWSPASGESGGSSGCGAVLCGRESVTAAQV